MGRCERARMRSELGPRRPGQSPAGKKSTEGGCARGGPGTMSAPGDGHRSASPWEILASGTWDLMILCWIELGWECPPALCSHLCDPGAPVKLRQRSMTKMLSARAWSAPERPHRQELRALQSTWPLLATGAAHWVRRHQLSPSNNRVFTMFQGERFESPFLLLCE